MMSRSINGCRNHVGRSQPSAHRPGDAIELLERIEEGFCALDRELKIAYVNAGAERIWQRRREELIGRRPEEVVPGLADKGARRALAAALGDGNSRCIDLAAAPAGRRIQIKILPDRAGLWLYLRNSSAQHSMAQQLRERDELLTMAERSAGIGVWDIDLATQMVRGTPEFWRIMGACRRPMMPCRSKLPGVFACPKTASASPRGSGRRSAITPTLLKWSIASGARTARFAGFSGAVLLALRQM